MPKCKNCQTDFSVSERDKKFYSKIDVPEPTWCSRCREMRRMAWCNEGNLYSRTCELCRKSIISQLSPDNPRLVYCINCWWSDKYNPLDYGREIDWDRSIIDQIHELELKVPHACVSVDIGSVNSDYTHHAGQEKNCYMIFHATFAEDCYYGYGVKKAKDCVDVHYCHQSEFCYECTDVKDCYNLAWCQDCSNCGTSYFLRDCKGCLDCFLCVGLVNKKFCFLNEQLTQAEYKERLSKVNTGSYREIQKCLKQFSDLQGGHTFRCLQNNMLENSLGDHLYNAKNSFYCFDCSDIEESSYCSQMQLGVKFCYDIYQYGVQAELCYEGAMVGTNAYNCHFCYLCLWQVSDLDYCLDSYSSSNCFGCFGLNKNKYCILNKQYERDEYFEVRKKLISKMAKDGEYGEFFPIKYSQSAYNETTANLWFPMMKDEVLGKGWQWQDKLPGTYGKETLRKGGSKDVSDDISDGIKDVPGSIIDEVLACEGCKKNFKIIPQELKYYKKLGYPIPRRCFECRRLGRMKLRNPHRFWERKCALCGKEIFSSYSPSRPEKICCEECYRREVHG